ncbi:MAG TPA: SCO family protein [Verrucomicrobiae bacterium]|nr:SCO family protein [Verrucomicrobiae bacterium]
MKPRTVFTILCAVTVLIVIAASVLTHHRNFSATDDAQIFQVFGQVRGLDVANKTIRIAHEEIPNYMPAMTMPFSVKDTALLNGLATGDRVKFELVVTKDDSWISRVEKIGGTENEMANAPGASAEDREAERIHTGEKVPDFTLMDQNGKPIRLSDFRGKAVVMTFIYTRCPIPNFCPLVSKNFAELQERLSKEFPGRFMLLSVTMDYQFDRPPVLKEYAARFGADEKCWTFATGSEEQIGSVAALMGLFFEPENGLISHDLRTTLIGPDGRLAQLWKSNVWTPYEVQRRVGEILKDARN